MEKITTHKLASLCQRMPVDTYIMCLIGDDQYACRVVKTDLAELLRGMDGRTSVTAELRLDGLYVYG